MTPRLLAAALVAALALPALGAEPQGAEKRATQLDFNFNFDLDLGELLADATGALRGADAAREHAGLIAEQMSQWAEQFTANMEGSMAFMFGDRMGRGKVVKGAPYSADVVTETNQTLPDGNVISHRSTSRVYRDAEGRTRQETYRNEAVRSIYISDPVAAMSYTLIPGAKIAVGIPRVEHRMSARARAGVSGREKTTQDEENKIVVRTVEGSDDAPGARQEIRVQVVRIGEGDVASPSQRVVPVPPVPPLAPVPPVPLIPGVHTMRFESTAHLGKGVTSSLGTRDFEGVKAEGKSTVWTIPAGKIGNRNPIDVTSESWDSPELQVTMYSRHNDPRTGESIYRLAAVKRSEPAAELFKVPEGYKLKGRAKREEKP
jgi:hypothetical protein